MTREQLHPFGLTPFHNPGRTSHLSCAGAVFNGYYKAIYESEEAASSAKASVQAAWNKYGASAKGSFDFEKSGTSTTGFMKSEAGLKVVGWNSKIAPDAVRSMKTLDAAAAVPMSTLHGERVEAVLSKYTDVEEYHQALQEYQTSTPADEQESYTPISVRCHYTPCASLCVLCIPSDRGLRWLWGEGSIHTGGPCKYHQGLLGDYHRTIKDYWTITIASSVQKLSRKRI